MNVLCIGHLSYDVFCPMNEFPLPNKKYRVNERIECGGGPAANAAYLLGKWGVKTTLAGVVGSDDFGTKIKKELEGVQVDTSFIETSYDKPTSLSFIIINKNDATRTVINTYKSEYGQLRKYDFGMTPDIILLDGHEFSASREALQRNTKAISVLDASRTTPEILELCKFVKYIVCSKEFAETNSNLKFDFNNPNSLVGVYQTLKNRFPNNEIVITLEDKGALYTSNDEIKIMPGLKTTVIDTTGAGDIFHGAFIYGLANNFPMDKTVTYANIAAGLSLGKIGTRLSMPSLNEVINYYNQKFPPQNSSATTAPATSAPTNNTAPVPPVQPTSQPNNANPSGQVPSAASTETNQVPTQAIPNVMPEIPNTK